MPIADIGVEADDDGKAKFADVLTPGEMAGIARHSAYRAQPLGVYQIGDV